MPTYRYTARDAQQHNVAGHLEAPSVEAARRQLEQQGLQVWEVIEAEAGPPEPARPAPLAHEEAEQFVDNLAQLSAAGLPLPSGLRAAAEETDNSRLAAALLYLADQLEQGRPLEEIVTSPDLPLPRYTSRLIDTAARTGQLGPALMELVEHDRVLDGLRRDLWRGLAYPLCVAGTALAVLLFLSLVVSGSFEQIYRDFGVKLPAMTLLLFAWRHVAPWLVPTVVALVIAVVLLLRWWLSPLVRRRWLATVPGIGPLWHWMGLLEWIGLLKVMVRNEVPLFEALRLSADGASDANIAQVSQTLADGVARGRSLSHGMQSQRAIPASLVPLVRWGEEAGTLAESLDTASEVLQQRVRMRSLWLQMALPPLLFIAIGCGVLGILGSLLMPMMSLISTLTGPASRGPGYVDLTWFMITIPLILVAIGVAILWTHSWVRFRGGAMELGWVEDLLVTVGWVLLVLGIFATVGITTGLFFLLAWVVTAVVLMTLFLRYRATEQRSLLWMLMVAAERGIPLEAAARAFAEERRDRLATRAMDLAEYLEAGLPLAVALRRSGLSFPPDILLAAELGQQTGRLGEGLRQAMLQADQSEAVLQSAAERFFYLSFLVGIGLALWTFLLLKIVPAMEKINHDFGRHHSLPMELMSGVGWVLANYWFITMPLGALLVIAFLVILSHYMGYSLRYLPGIRSVWGRVDSGIMMHWLAVAVRQNRPLPEMMRLLAGYLGRRGLRGKLQRAAKRVDQGADWTDSLRRYGLVRRFEVAVLKSAGRAGNLAWALEEMAQTSARRSDYRLRALMNIAFPAALLVLGSAVLLIALAVLTNLFYLIQSMSSFA